MIIIDSSVLVAISQKEDNFISLLQVLKNEDCYISAATLQETFIVIYARKEEAGRQEMETLFENTGIIIIPFDEEILKIAMDGYVKYGKGQNADAALNYGDCFSYATAKFLDAPLFFIGDDFTHTDIETYQLPN